MVNITISVSEADKEYIDKKGWSPSRIFRYAMYRAKTGEVLDIQNVDTMDALVDYIATLRQRIDTLVKANASIGRKENAKLATKDTEN